MKANTICSISKLLVLLCGLLLACANPTALPTPAAVTLAPRTSSATSEGQTTPPHVVATSTSAHTPPTHTPVAHATAYGTVATPFPATPFPPPAAFTPTANVSLRVDGATRYQTFSGFGATFAPFNRPGNKLDDPNAPAFVSVTDAQRDALIQIWFRELGLTRTRLFPDSYEPVNDNADPFDMNPAGYDWSMVNQVTDFARLARSAGLQTYWASFSMDLGDKQAWLRLPDSCSLDPQKLDEDVEWVLAAALRFREQGVELPYLTVNNEPDLPECKNRVKIELADYLTLVKRLGARMRDAGLQTKLVISDGWLPENVVRYAQAVLADPDARQYVGALAYHAYADGYDDPGRILENSAASKPPHTALQPRAQIRELAARYNLPIWMTEICYCAPRSHEFSEFELLRARLNHLHDELTIGNVAAFDAINLYNIRRPGVYDELIEVFYRPDGTIERYPVSTYGALLGQYARAILPGAVRVQAESSDPRVRIVAFQRPDGKPVVVVLNNNSFAVQATLNFANVNPLPRVLVGVTSREGAIGESLGEIALDGANAAVILPPRSVTTLVGE
ncbi:MAG: hypothetical protein HY741_27750 [Chloroflexi bacterium]|nr:hypothetical protein [Chloroflexota bacterium]